MIRCSADRLLGLSLRQLESVLATVVATVSGEATPTSSNALTISRQMAELFCAKSEYGSLRRRNFTSMDGLCSRLIGASGLNGLHIYGMTGSQCRAIAQSGGLKSAARLARLAFQATFDASVAR